MNKREDMSTLIAIFGMTKSLQMLIFGPHQSAAHDTWWDRSVFIAYIEVKPVMAETEE